jgi:LDH2 family malate/lactate/ureidoglycolate dehydrogenase
LTADGQPTTDAAEALRGTVQTMAGHKGYALALMVEIFSSVLSGAAIGPEIGSMYTDLDRAQNVGHFFCLFDIGAFMPVAHYQERMGGMLERLKANKRQPGVEEILIPGERSDRRARASHVEGLQVADETVAELQKWCAQLGVAWDVKLVEV